MATAFIQGIQGRFILGPLIIGRIYDAKIASNQSPHHLDGLGAYPIRFFCDHFVLTLEMGRLSRSILHDGRTLLFLEKAEPFFTQARSLDSTYIPDKLNLALLLVRKNRYDEARTVKAHLS